MTAAIAALGRRHPVTLEEGLRRLAEASKAVLSVLETDRLLEVLMDQAVQLIRADRGFLMLAEEGGELGYRIGRGFDRALLAGDEEVISRSVAEEVFRTRRPILSMDALGDDALRNRKSVLELRLQTVICVPLVARERTLGVLYLDSHHALTAFDETSLAVVQALADLAAIALDNARLYALATTDPKTGLANSGFFHTRLEAALEESARSGRAAALVLVDLDHFKRVNDTWGHPAGDQVLREVAAILRRSVRAQDLAARWGGEEFALLLAPTPEERLDPGAVAERVRRAIEEHEMRLAGGAPLVVTASLGIARAPGGRRRSSEELVAAADRCLYEAKRLGRNRVVAE